MLFLFSALAQMGVSLRDDLSTPLDIDQRREAAAIFGMKQFRSEIRPSADLMQEALRWSRYPNEWKRMKDVFCDNENTQSVRNFIGKYENVTSAFAEDAGDHMVIGNTMFTKDFLITIDVDSRIIDLFVRIKLRDEDIRDLSNLPPYLQVCTLMSYRRRNESF